MARGVVNIHRDVVGVDGGVGGVSGYETEEEGEAQLFRTRGYLNAPQDIP